jgi:pimeloyl-ACP methyl ester carboxylesterase
VPLNYLASNLDDMGDFPYKNPDEIRYNKPTLFVRGTKSPYIADEMLPIIGRFFPKFELADVEAGHWVISENPEGFKTGKSSGCDRIGCVLTYVSCGGLATES